jgi:DNA polymerase-1
VEPEKDPVKNRVNICMFDGCNAPPTYLKGSGANTKQLCEAHLNDPAYKRLKKIEPMPPEPQATFRIHQDLSPRQVVYAAFDAMWMPRLAWDQLQELHAHRDRQGRTPWPYLFKLECDVAEAIARMELHGIPINRGQAMRTHIALLHEAKRLEHELITMLKDHPDEEVKLGSQVYMVPKLNARGIPLPNYRGAELKRHIDHEVIRKILRWKSVTKMMDFTLSFLTKVSAVTKRVHASFNQYQTSTSRLSSSGPNFQNIPSKAKESKELRACVDAEACEDNDPNDPWTFIICDLSNIEMRLLAEWTMDASMIDLFIRDKDAHCLTAARNMGVTYEEMYQRYKVDKIPEFVKARNNAKVPNFGLSYGAGWPKLKIMAWEQYGLVWSDAEAQTQRNGYFSTFPGVGGWHQRIKTDIKNGYGPYIVENSLGRVRVMPREVTMEEDGKIQRVSCYQRALNFPIQSNGAEIVKRAMVALMRQWQIVLQVHDELVVKCKKSQAEACLAAVVAAMEGAGAGILVHVPNKADGQISSKWKK